MSQSAPYPLAIGDRTYSSWSLRGWLLFANFGLAVETHLGRLYDPDFERLLAEFKPARTVPALRLPSGLVIPDTIAIAETLADLHPDAGHWPEDPDARAMARWLCAEMHSGFTALRSDCAMNLAVSYADSHPRAEVLADLARIEMLWDAARARFGEGGPWLFGTYTAADAFYAPVAARIAGYNLPVGPDGAAYVAAHLADPAFRRWRAMGKAENFEQPSYKKPYPARPWPGPKPIPAVEADGPSVNDTCPYSGKPVTHFLSTGGKTWGFCNAFCRNKTVADPEAWPAFMAMFNAPARYVT